MTRYVVLMACVASVFWAYSNWRLALRATLVLAVLEGALRKWVFPDAQDLVYFAKDILLVGVYAGFLASRPWLRVRIPVPDPLKALLAAAVLYGVLEIFNPTLPNVLVGGLGFKAYFWYVPFLWVVPAAFTSSRDLWRFGQRFAKLAIPVCLLAVLQFASPASSSLNVYARGGSERIATFGSSRAVRVTGTFSYITGLTSFLLATTLLILALLAASRWRFRGNALLLTALCLCILAMLMSGSRGPFVLLLAMLPFYFLLSVARERQGAATGGRILVFAVAVAVVLGTVGSSAIAAFTLRARSATDATSRILAPFTSPFSVLDTAGIIGSGIGSTHQAASVLTRGDLDYAWLRGTLVETETGKIMVELGLIGFLLVMLVRVALLAVAVRQVFALHAMFHRVLATSILLVVANGLVGAVVFDPTSDVLYWFLAGVLILLSRLDAEETAAALADRHEGVKTFERSSQAVTHTGIPRTNP